MRTEMTPFKEVISYEDALNLLLESITPINECELVPLSQGTGRVLAQDITSDIDVPFFNRAAMDGYAVIAKDTFTASNMSPTKLEVMGEVFAGDRPSFSIKKEQCGIIATGAPLPKGADGVVMVENTDNGRD